MTVGRQSTVAGRQFSVLRRPVVSPRSSRQATPSILKPKGKPLQWRFNYSDGHPRGHAEEPPPARGILQRV